MLLVSAATAVKASTVDSEDDYVPDLPLGDGRQIIVSNISAVITYVSFVVALVMLAGFAYVAFAFRCLLL